MKTLIALALTGVLALSLAACGTQTNKDTASEGNQDTVNVSEESETTITEVAPGGFEKASSPVITDEIKALVEKAKDGMMGASYTPVAYIASQVVSGTNHLVLCKVEAAVPTYAIVTLYEDLEGNVEITDILDSTAEAPANDDEAVGAFTECEDPTVTTEAQEALTKACEGMLGADYTPIALLSTQVVSGTNYQFLCEITAATPDAEPAYSIVTVYESLDGAAEITETVDFIANNAE